jgi:hypothetical protein
MALKFTTSFLEDALSLFGFRMLRMETIQYNLPQTASHKPGTTFFPICPSPMAPPLHPGTLQPIGPTIWRRCFP